MKQLMQNIKKEGDVKFTITIDEVDNKAGIERLKKASYQLL